MDKVRVYIQWNPMQPQEKMKQYVLHNLEKIGGYAVKQNKNNKYQMILFICGQQRRRTREEAVLNDEFNK